MDKTIKKRQAKNKELILSLLRKTPIVQLACDRSNISRATYYRWRKQSPEFAKDSDRAIYHGNLLINDMAESQLMSAIKDKNMTAIIFWLKYHHPAYLTKVEITSGNQVEEKLSPEQQSSVKKALTLAGIVNEETQNKKDG